LKNRAKPTWLADLVAAAGTSQFHFSRAFHAATGRSPYQYLIARRIEHAKVLLMTADVDLATVANRCGFNSAHQFAAMFKRHAGVGPKRFRLSRTTRAVRQAPAISDPTTPELVHPL